MLWPMKRYEIILVPKSNNVIFISGTMKLIWGQEKQHIGNLQAFRHFGQAYRQLTENLELIQPWNIEKNFLTFVIWTMVSRFLLGTLWQLIHHTVSFSMCGRSLECYQRGILLWTLFFISSSSDVFCLMASYCYICFSGTRGNIF